MPEILVINALVSAFKMEIANIFNVNGNVIEIVFDDESKSAIVVELQSDD